MTVDTFAAYQSHSRQYAIYEGQGKLEGIIYATLGLSEAAEIQGKVKKIIRDYGGVVTPEMRKALGKEIGDTLWYLSQLATELDLNLGVLASNNLAKLQDREDRGVLQGEGDER